MEAFICDNSGNEEMPVEVINGLGITARDIYINGKTMASLAQKIKEYNNDVIAKIPFTTVDFAEALGVKIQYFKDNIPPLVSEYIYHDIDDLIAWKKCDFSSPMLTAVMDALQLLEQQNIRTIVKLEGPFTNLNFLLEMKKIFLIEKNNPHIISAILDKLCDDIFTYIKILYENGCKAISYADPSGYIGIVGPDFARRVSDKYNYKLLKRLQDSKMKMVVFLCGNTSISLVRSGYAVVDKKMVAIESLGQAILNYSDADTMRMIGHTCLRKSAAHLKNSYLNFIELNKSDERI